jgi:hypothetical protein
VSAGGHYRRLHGRSGRVVRNAAMCARSGKAPAAQIYAAAARSAIAARALKKSARGVEFLDRQPPLALGTG